MVQVAWLRSYELFLELLRLKKAGKVFSVFTRSGNILACRSRDSAPIRIASPEALRQLAGSGAARRPVQERAQSGARSGLLDGVMSGARRSAPLPASGVGEGLVTCRAPGTLESTFRFGRGKSGGYYVSL